MSTTIKDVAKRANVSTSTVSRVISNSPRISDETKEKVKEIIKELNYHPNIIARNLAERKTRTLGLILPNEAEDLFKNPFFVQAMKGISIYAQKKGYNMMYSFGKDDKEELSYIKNYIDTKLVDGLVLLTVKENDHVIEYLKSQNFPFVVIGRPENSEEILWVDNDNFQAMYNVVNTLIVRGHKSLAFIGAIPTMMMSRDRLDGFRRALIVHGIPINEALISEKLEFSEECGYAATMEILSSERPSAIITTDDLLAFGAMKALKETKNIDVSLVGFNNTPLAEYHKPSLSSVDINACKLGYQAAKLLISKLNIENLVNTHYIVDTYFVERESTKKIANLI